MLIFRRTSWLMPLHLEAVMIDELQEFAQGHHGCLLVSKRYSIPDSDDYKVWISISQYEVENCLILGKGRRIHFYIGVNCSIGSQEAWMSCVKSFMLARGHRVSRDYETRLTVYDLSERDRMCLIRFCCPMNIWFSAWRQVSRCWHYKEELMQKACCPSRLLQI